MQNKNCLTIIVLIMAAVTLDRAVGKCNTCLSNGVVCLNETSFHICYGSVIDTTQEFSCPADEVCTGLQIICAPAAQIMPACSATTDCANCGVGGFTCTSRSTFALCSGNDITNITGKCPNDYICDASSTSPNLCVKSCKGEVTCDIPDPIV